jgi:hypothetical protein
VMFRRQCCIVATVAILLSAVAGTAGTEPTEAPAPRANLVLELVNGSRFIGAPEDGIIELTTDYGILPIPLTHVSTISMNHKKQTALLVLANGDRASGTISRQGFLLNTIIGEVNIPLSTVRRGRVSMNGAIDCGMGWSEAVQGLSVRLSSKTATLQQGQKIRLLLEIKNVTTNALSIPYPHVARTVDGGRGRAAENLPVTVHARRIKRAGDEELDVLHAFQRVHQRESSDIVLGPAETAIIKLMVETRSEDLLSEMMEDVWENLDPGRPIILREYLTWHVRPGQYGLRAVIERPANADKIRGAHATKKVWKGKLTSREIEVEIAK